jgi:hypothetical protein
MTAKRTGNYVRKITDINMMREACDTNNGQADFFIYLHKVPSTKAYLRSSKEISYWKTRAGNDRWEVFHSISGEFVRYSKDEILTETLIGEAIKQGRFYQDVYPATDVSKDAILIPAKTAEASL